MRHLPAKKSKFISYIYQMIIIINKQQQYED